MRTKKTVKPTRKPRAKKEERQGLFTKSTTVELNKKLKPLDVLEKARERLLSGKGNGEHDGLIIFSRTDEGSSIFAHASMADFERLFVSMLDSEHLDLSAAKSKLEAAMLNKLFGMLKS